MESFILFQLQLWIKVRRLGRKMVTTPRCWEKFFRRKCQHCFWCTIWNKLMILRDLFSAVIKTECFHWFGDGLPGVAAAAETNKPPFCCAGPPGSWGWLTGGSGLGRLTPTVREPMQAFLTVQPLQLLGMGGLVLSPGVERWRKSVSSLSVMARPSTEQTPTLWHTHMYSYTFI